MRKLALIKHREITDEFCWGRIGKISSNIPERAFCVLYVDVSGKRLEHCAEIVVGCNIPMTEGIGDQLYLQNIVRCASSNEEVSILLLLNPNIVPGYIINHKNEVWCCGGICSVCGNLIYARNTSIYDNPFQPNTRAHTHCLEGMGLRLSESERYIEN